MSVIRKLEPRVVDQIAAGEVVERPASVVKELVENSLDAGATRIEVRLKEGGIRHMEVRDDGCGIAPDEMVLALTSHATSKLRDVQDLDAIGSLGFRGEALASIAAVSRLTLVSRRPEDSAASSLKVQFGRMGEVQAAAGPIGTRFVVEDLFAELPARLKFLKRPATELAHCAGWLERLTLAHHGIGFHLEHGGRVLLDVSADADLGARCAAVFGQGVSERMVAIEEKAEAAQLIARVGPPEAARRDASRVHIFLNGRWVRDPKLLRAVREGVREFVEIGHYPMLYLSLSMPPESVDVNVHPQKLEVRFRDERFLFAFVMKALQRGLASSQWATRSIGGIGGAQEQERTASMEAGSATSSSSYQSRFPSPSQVWERPVKPASPTASEPPPPAPTLPLASEPEVAGQDPETSSEGPLLSVANTFLIREVPGGMEILDQHALHERVNLEELRQEIREGQVIAQPLLVPALVDLTREEVQLLAAKAEVFKKLGVELEAFGDTTIALRAVPARLQRLVPERLVEDLLAIAREHRQASPEKIQEEMLHSMSCRGAVMAGDRLDMEALRSLLRRGAGLPQDRTCAHGRPVRVFLSIEDLERAFHRR